METTVTFTDLGTTSDAFVVIVVPTTRLRSASESPRTVTSIQRSAAPMLGGSPRRSSPQPKRHN